MLAQQRVDEHAFGILLGRILRAGVTAAAGIVMCGGSMYLWRRGGSATDYGVFRGEPADFRTVRGILSEAGAGTGRGLIQLGLLVLVATPVVRVLCSVAGFARERDWVYVSITLAVLALLAYSLFAS